MERRDVWMALSQIPKLVGLGEPELFEEPQRIGIPSRQIQIASDGEVVELGVEAHEIMRDIAPRRMPTDDFHLQPVEAGDLVGGEAVVVQPVAGVGLGDGQVRRQNLVEIPIFLRPEHRPPRPVERVHRLIPLCQPDPELLRGVLRVADRCIVAAKLIVGLPCANRRVAAIPTSHSLGYPRTLAAVGLAGKAVVAS